MHKFCIVKNQYSNFTTVKYRKKNPSRKPETTKLQMLQARFD